MSRCSDVYVCNCHNPVPQNTTTQYNLFLSSPVTVDQHTRPPVYARIHDLVAPPSVRQSSFRSTSRRSSRSLVEDDHVLMCYELAGIAQKYRHAETVCFVRVTQETQLPIFYCNGIVIMRNATKGRYNNTNHQQTGKTAVDDIGR